MSSVRERLGRLRKRLLVANLRSRSIRLVKATRSGAFDLARLAEVKRKAHQRVLAAMGRVEAAHIDLVPARGGSDAEKAIAEDLRVLAHAAHQTWMDVGEDELVLGWPVLEARLEDTWLRAPLLLYPAALARSRTGKLVWRLTLGGRPDVNEVLAQTLFRLSGARLDLDALYARDEDRRLRPDDETWAAIRGWLADAGLKPEDEPGPGLPALAPLGPRLRADWDAVPEGAVRLAHHLVLGRFPQSSSNVLGDYNELESRLALLDHGPAAELLAVDVDAAPARALPMAPELDPPDAADEVGAVVRVLPSDASQEAVLRPLMPPRGARDAATPEAELEAPVGGMVVRGPPGTGKSQLIANLVGQAIDRGQAVLVVCQKRAALDVVAARLAEVGLEEPLALVHDVHHDRNDFCAGLAQTLSVVLDEIADADAPVRDEVAAMARYERAQERLAVRLEAAQEAYQAMLAPGPGGVPLAALLERALDDDGRALPDLAPVLADTSAGAEPVTEAGAIVHLPAMERMARRARPLAAPHALAARGDWAGHDADTLAAVRAGLEAWRAQLAACGEAGAHASMTPGQARAHLGLWGECAPLLDLFATGAATDRERFIMLWHFTDAGRRDSDFLRLLERLRAARDQLEDVPARLYAATSTDLAGWQAELADLAALETRWWRPLVPRFWRLRRRRAEVRAACVDHDHAGRDAGAPMRALVETTPRGAASLAARCDMALRWHGLVREVTEILFAYPFYTFGCQGRREDVERALEDLEAIHARIAQVHRLHDALGAAHPAYAEVPALELDGDGSEPAAPGFLAAAVADRERALLLESAEKTAERLAAHFRRDWLEPLLAAAAQGAPELAPIDAVLAAWDDAPEAASLDAELAGLPPWARGFLRAYRPADGAGVELGFEPGSLEADLVLALERAWRALARGTRTLHEAEAALVDEAQRAALDAAHAELTAATGPAVHAGYRAVLRAAAADRASGRALRKLLGDARKRRHRRSIRQLVEAYWDQGLRALRPVWLCSPDSVAALFPLVAGLFELVVLDEASQCPVESALPALVRGKRVLVAGDEKQMPPSHFFSSRDDDADDDDDPGALLAADSILDVARVAYPGVMLRYHYRSRHEELIAFSNHAFYEGRLVTAPPAERARAAHEGLHFERVDGRWRDQVNEEEATAAVTRVLDLLDQRLPGGRRPSVGVVTFNQKQRARIEALLDTRAAEDERARALLADEWERPATEALFVKNLENVQGDERDVIVFSAGYGPDASGRVAARFGPVGQDGGENRLNVAITRARTGVHVLASFTPDMLDVSGTRHVGPRLLRLYFDYVYEVSERGAASAGRVLREVAAVAGAGQAGAGATGAAGEGAPRVGRRVQDELAAALEHAGLVVTRDLGIGPHRLDLALRRGPGRGRGDRAERWDLGVDCTRFLATADPVQRDVTEPAFWRRAGWRVVRVSPALWLERRDAVVQGILELVAR